MTLYKKSLIVLSAVLLSTMIWAKGKTEVNPDTVRVSGLNGPSSIGLSYLFENPPVIDEVTSTFEVSASPDVLLPKMIKGEIDIGVLPINVAAKVYNANNGAILLAGISGKGMMSILSKDASITSLKDLEGKKLAVAGQGGTPEYMIKYLLDETNVQLDFSIPTSEIAAALISDKIENALLVEPFASVAQLKDSSKSIKRVIDIQEVYKDKTGKSDNYPVTAIVVRAAFAKENPKLLRSFLEKIDESINWVNTNPKDAGSLVEKHGLGLQAAIVAKSIPTSALTWTNAINSKESVEALLSVFLEAAPASIGGTLPDKDFYFK